VGRYSLGVLNIQTGDAMASGTGAGATPVSTPSTNFGVLRLKRDILRQSSVGAIYTRRSIGAAGTGPNLAYGVDGAFNFYNDLAVNTYWARTQTEGTRGDDISYRAQLNFPGDRYGVQVERLRVDGQFNPEMGFVRRAAIRRTLADVRFSPRPRRRFTAVRRFWWQGTVDYFENSGGRVEYREQYGEFAVEFQNSDRVSLAYLDLYEYIPRPFRISGVVVPVGGYDWRNVRLAVTFSPQRRLAGNLTVEQGGFYDGRRTAVSVSRGRLAITPRFATEPTYSLNHVELPTGTFTTHLAGSRVIYTMGPRMFTSALVQYNSTARSVSANVRLRWEYQPGSELFVVYNDERNTQTRGFPELLTRSLVVKVNRLFRF